MNQRNPGQFDQSKIACTLVTQPMLQRRPIRTELRSMDSFIQILSRFQKSKQKVPPPTPVSNERSPQRKFFLILRWGGGLEEFGYKNSSILTPCDLVNVAT